MKVFPRSWRRYCSILAGLGAILNAWAAEPFDLVIRGGKVIDGTGNPWFYGDVGIRGSRIAALGKLDGLPAKKTLDAKGHFVSPGFIDIHSHSDWTIFEDGAAQSKIRQGVTTEVIGEGGSVAPAIGKLDARRVKTSKGTEHAVRTLDDYFKAFEESGVAVNIASYTGLGNLWECVMGKSFDRPTAGQIEEMRALLAKSLDEGSFGLSSQLMMPPGSLARPDELVQICGPLKEKGGLFSSHIRNEGLGVFDAVNEVIGIAERASVPLDVIHLKIADEKYWGRMPEVAAMIEAARQRGVNVQANVYPYTRGNNDLSSIIPPWAHEGGNSAMLARLRDPATRTRMKKDIQNGVEGWYNHYTAVGRDWSRMLISANHPDRGRTMDQVIASRSAGRTPPPDPLDILFDLLLESGGSVGTVYAHHSEKDMNTAMAQPWCSIGSDGSALSIEGTLRRGNPHPRSFGTFPRVLGEYVRERGLLRWEEAVRKMSSANALRLGIMDRGVLRAGNYADIVVFDPVQIKDRSTYAEPFAYNTGVTFVIVNGQLVLDHDQHTGARPGKALRKGREL